MTRAKVNGVKIVSQGKNVCHNHPMVHCKLLIINIPHTTLKLWACIFPLICGLGGGAGQCILLLLNMTYKNDTKYCVCCLISRNFVCVDLKGKNKHVYDVSHVSLLNGCHNKIITTFK
jgi:hypothetical protein